MGLYHKNDVYQKYIHQDDSTRQSSCALAAASETAESHNACTGTRQSSCDLAAASETAESHNACTGTRQSSYDATGLDRCDEQSSTNNDVRILKQLHAADKRAIYSQKRLKQKNKKVKIANENMKLFNSYFTLS